MNAKRLIDFKGAPPIIPIKAKKIFIVSFEQQTLKKTNFSYFQKEFYLKTILY